MKKSNCCRLMSFVFSVAFVFAAVAAGDASKDSYVDPNPYASYGAAMASKARDPMAVEWQNRCDRAVKAATAPDVLASHVSSTCAALSLLKCVKGAYATDPLVLIVVASTTQYVMDPAADRCRCGCFRCGDARKVWSEALLLRAGSTSDAYVAMLCLDQLRWCGFPSQVAAVRNIGEKSKDRAVRDFAAMVARELAK